MELFHKEENDGL